MIRRLRKRFIRIATLAVTAVLLVLCLSVNIANYISVDSGLTNVLNVISDNRGTMPPMPHGQPPEGRPDGQLTKETPFSTRYFVLRYDGDGDLIKADLDKIAAVTEDDVGEYLSLALEHGEGYGYARGYKYRVVYNGEDRWTIIRKCAPCGRLRWCRWPPWPAASRWCMSLWCFARAARSTRLCRHRNARSSLSPTPATS